MLWSQATVKDPQRHGQRDVMRTRPTGAWRGHTGGRVRAMARRPCRGRPARRGPRRQGPAAPRRRDTQPRGHARVHGVRARAYAHARQERSTGDPEARHATLIWRSVLQDIVVTDLKSRARNIPSAKRRMLRRGRENSLSGAAKAVTSASAVPVRDECSCVSLSDSNRLASLCQVKSDLLFI